MESKGGFASCALQVLLRKVFGIPWKNVNNFCRNSSNKGLEKNLDWDQIFMYKSMRNELQLFKGLVILAKELTKNTEEHG